MKTYAFAVVLSLIVTASLQAKIKNGYERDLALAREGLKNLRELLCHDTLSFRARKRIKKYIETHEQVIRYHELTLQFLMRFREIATEIYDEADTVRDPQGRNVDIYVKLQPPGKQGQFMATANVSLASEINTYQSRYGINTASISVEDRPYAFHLFAHELGHMLYQIRNVEAYRLYFSKTYPDHPTGVGGRGHDNLDPSGWNARKYEGTFRKNYVKHKKICKA